MLAAQSLDEGRAEVRVHDGGDLGVEPVVQIIDDDDLILVVGRGWVEFHLDKCPRQVLSSVRWRFTLRLAACSQPAALRTLKSDVITGLDQQMLTTLNSTDEQWRTNGTHALIQVRP